MNTRYFLKEQGNSIFVHVDITGNGIRVKNTTGLKLQSKKDWNEKSSRFRGTDMNSISCNERISLIERRIGELGNDFLQGKIKLNETLIKRQMWEIVSPSRAKKQDNQNGKFTNLLLFLEDYLSNKRTEEADTTFLNKKSFLVAMREFAKINSLESLEFDNINLDFFNDFKDYLFRERDHNINSVKKYTDSLKGFMKIAIQKKLTTNIDYLQFKVKSFIPDTIALKESEVDELMNLKLKNNELEFTRDMFCFTCYSGLRFSDVALINKHQRKGDSVLLRTKKTDNDIEIPLRKQAIAILDKYNDNDGKFVVPCASSYNRRIKRVCKQVTSLKEKMEIHTSSKGVKKTELVEKWEMISSHTGRRTFCTNAYLGNIPIKVIIAVSGHKTISQFEKYLRIDNKVSSKMLKDAFKKMDEVKAT